MGKRKSGERLERIVAALEKALNESLAVDRRVRLRDRRSSELREFDVVMSVPGPHGSLSVVVECKEHARKIGQPLVESFVQKCEDVGVHQRVIVSQSGYSRGAIKKAEAHGVVLLTLDEADELTWPPWLGASHLSMVEDKFELVAAVLLGLDGTPLPRIEGVAYREPFFRTGEGRSATLEQVLGQWLKRVKANGTVKVPERRRVRTTGSLNFSPPAEVLVPGPARGHTAAQLRFEVELWREHKKLPVRVHSLRRLDGPEDGVAVVSDPVTILGRRFEVIMVAKPGDDEGRRLSVQVVPLERAKA